MAPPPACRTGAAVHADVLPPRVLASLERDLASIIEAFDGGYAPPDRPNSLTSGAPPASSVGTVVLPSSSSNTTTRASR